MCFGVQETWSDSHVDPRTAVRNCEKRVRSRFCRLRCDTGDTQARKKAPSHAKYAAFHRAQLHTNAPEPPKNMGWLHRANEKDVVIQARALSGIGRAAVQKIVGGPVQNSGSLSSHVVFLGVLSMSKPIVIDW